MQASMPSNRSCAGRAPLALLLAFACAAGAQAQSPDRERAQMMQLQQQLQRLQQDKASLEAKAGKDSEQLKQRDGEVAAARRDLARARGDSAARGKENDALRDELERSKQSLAAAQADIERLQKEIALRDGELEKAAQRRREADQAQSLLAERLKQQTGRGDLCEVKHAQAMALAGTVIDDYEKQRLRMCEPITGIYKVREEDKVQQLRERLYESRLDAAQAGNDKR